MIVRSVLSVALLGAVASAADPFVATTPGSPGTGGLVPALSGSGPGAPGSANALLLTDALASSHAALVVGLDVLGVPLKGGLLGPAPDLVLAGLPLEAGGALVVPFTLPHAGVLGVGTGLWFQAWVDDDGAASGFASSNTLQLVVADGPPEPLFALPASPGLGLSPTDSLPRPLVAAADLDRDGRLDVATRFGDVFTGNGDGTFTHASSLSTGPAGASVAAADLDGDGVVDLAFSNDFADRIRLFLGAGDATFAEVAPIEVGADPAFVALGDVDADGVVDVVSARGDEVVVFIGAGGLTYDAPLVVGTLAAARTAHLADLDADGVVDLLVAGDDLGVAIGAGDGAFGPLVPHPVAGTIDAIVTHDLDLDGALDVVVAAGWLASFATPGRVSVLRGLGDGGLAPADAYDVGRHPRDVSVTHLDDDGLPDLVVACDVDATLVALRGTGRARFVVADVATVQPAPRAMLTADLDGDGVDDHVVIGSDHAGAALGVADGFVATPRHDDVASVVASSEALACAAVGDVTGDGIDDVVSTATGAETSSLLVQRGVGDGSLRPATLLATDALRSVTIVDVDLDGHGDLVGVHHDGERVSILRGLGDGTFAPAVHLEPGGEVTDAGFAVGDVDGDGLCDVIVATPLATTRFTGLGALAFAPPVLVAQGSNAAALFDGDGDGALDLVLGDLGGDGVWFLPGGRDGTFGAQQLFAPGVAGTRFVVAHVDDDDALDVLMRVTTPSGPAARLVLGHGDGTFGAPIALVHPGPVDAFAAGDVDGDGHVDVVLGGATFGVLAGDGRGDFESRGTFATGARDLVLTDADGDGRLDVVSIAADTVVATSFNRSPDVP